MKKLTMLSGEVFGPFEVVEPLVDRFRCDGADLPFSVVGEGAITDWEGPLPSVTPAIPTRDELKQRREQAVAAIKVTVGNLVFDGDEESQTRMTRAIIGLQAAGAPTITWVLSDNTPAEVTLAELTTALVLAGQEQGRLWVID